MPRRQAKPATPGYLERVALAYLERYPGSTARVRAVLERRVRRSVEERGTDPREGADAVDAVIAKLARLGYLDDARFAASRVRSLRSRGKSARAVRAMLARQRIDAGLIDRALSDHAEAAEGDAELDAARALVRKKRLGPFRTVEARSGEWQRDLAKLARAGFGYGVARRALESLEDDDEG